MELEMRTLSRAILLRQRDVAERISVGELLEAEEEEEEFDDDDGEFEVAPKVKPGDCYNLPMDQWGSLCGNFSRQSY
jgi:hypothetical protein